MNKYRRVEKPKDTTPKDEEEIRVSAVGSVSAYVSRAAKLFGELEKKSLTITATGNALTKAVTSAEVIKRRFKGLHQITKLGSQEIVDEYEPLEEGLEKVTDTRSLPFVEIKLSKEALDTSDKGYQPPIDESLVKEMDDEEMMAPRGRGGGRGKGRGKGKSKGKGKGKGKGGKEESKGKGKKGKGKGDAEESFGKGKAKGKGKSKFDEPSKGKGKGKGKGKDRGYDRGYGSYDRGYDSYGGSKGKSKGKGKDRGYDRGSDSYGGSKGKSKGKGKGKSKGGWY